MNKRNIVLAAIVAVSFSWLLYGADPNVHTGATMSAPVYNVIATSSQMTTNPIGYRSTSGQIVPVAAAAPLPVNVSGTVSIASVTITASGSMDMRMASQTVPVYLRDGVATSPLYMIATGAVQAAGPTGFASDPIFNIATGNVQASISGGGATDPLYFIATGAVQAAGPTGAATDPQFITATGTLVGPSGMATQPVFVVATSALLYGPATFPSYFIATGSVTGAAASPVYTYATGTLPGPSGWATDPAYIWATGTLNGPTCWATNPAYLVATGANIDTKTDAINVMEYGHHEIHGGSSFTISSATASVANNASCEMYLVTPNTTKWAHLEWEVNLQYQGLIEIYEGPTMTATGSAMTVFNRDRNSATTATVAAYPLAGISANGTLLRQIYCGVGKTVVGSDRSTSEIILRQNTAYLFRVTNQSGSSAGYVNLKLDWYEHTNH